MPTTTFNIPQLTIDSNHRTFGPRPIPVGTSRIDLALDMSKMAPGQVLWTFIEWDDGSNIWNNSSLSDSDGPYIDKHTGLLVTLTSVAVIFDARVTDTWQIRATAWADNGPIVIPGGTLSTQ